MENNNVTLKSIGIALLLSAVLFSYKCHAQKRSNIWYFGLNAALDFSSGTAVALNDGSISTWEGCASISDNDGNHVLSSDGIVAVGNYGPIENGWDLLGNSSTSQSAIIVPKPGSENIYYIFTAAQGGDPDGLRYSEVDLVGATGWPAITANKNISLTTPISEHLTAVAHANGTDFWVLAHAAGNNNFVAYLITAQGINPQPVISSAGLPVINNVFGCMKISPAGNRLAMATNTEAQLFSFDNATGIVSGGQVLRTGRLYGIEFSPSGRVLYITDMDGNGIFQYDLYAGNIIGSEKNIFSDNSLVYGALQLGPDGRIYCSVWHQPALGVIRDPEVLGTACDYCHNCIGLLQRRTALGLPSFVQSWLYAEITANDNCNNAVSFSYRLPYQPDSQQWDFGDGETSAQLNPVHTYAAPGTYTVSVRTVKDGQQREIRKNIAVFAPPIANKPDDIYLCQGEQSVNLGLLMDTIIGNQPVAPLLLTFHGTLEHAQADTGRIPFTKPVTQTEQIIFARLANTATGCYAVTSFLVKRLEKLEINMQDTYFVCADDSITLESPTGYDSYSWSSGESSRSIIVSGPGVINLTVTKSYNGASCSGSIQITINAAEPPGIQNINTVDWTAMDNVITVVSNSALPCEYSIDGNNYQEAHIFDRLRPGKYTVHVKNRCGIATQDVYLLNYPKFFTPNQDGFNDTWQIDFGYFEPGLVISIFDRYGKLITSFKGTSNGWDGTYQGIALPSTDYWFAVKRRGKTYRGHFSLLR